MLDLKTQLIAERDEKKQLLKQLKKHYRSLSRYHRCSLKRRNRRGRGEYYKVTHRGKGNYPEKYLGPENHPEVQLIKQTYYLKTAIRKLDAMVRDLDHLIQSFWEYDPRVAEESFPRCYQNLPKECLSFVGITDPEAWLAKPRKYSDYKPEGKKYPTPDGWVVRSKSEVIICNTLRHLGIPYVYEEEHNIGGITIATDFTILIPKQGREILYEHFGMLSDQEYFEKFIIKLKQYLRAGYVPGVNLIITLEFGDGSLNPAMLEKTLSAWLS